MTYTRKSGDWEAWVSYFLEAVIKTAQQAVETAQLLMAQMKRDEDTLRQTPRIGSAVYQVLDVFKTKLAANSTSIIDEINLNAATVHNALGKLVQMGILSEITGKKRNRVYAYDACLKILNREFENGEE